MREDLVRRLFAAVLLSVPLSIWLAANARGNLQAMSTDPTGYVAHKQALQHPSVLGNYGQSLLMLGIVVVAVELVTFLLARVRLPSRSAA